MTKNADGVLALTLDRPIVKIHQAIALLQQETKAARTIWQVEYTTSQKILEFAGNIVTLDASDSREDIIKKLSTITEASIPYDQKELKEGDIHSIDDTYRAFHVLSMGFTYIPVVSPETGIEGTPESLSTLSEGIIFSAEKYPAIAAIRQAYAEGKQPTDVQKTAAAKEYLVALEGYRTWVHEKNVLIYVDMLNEEMTNKHGAAAAEALMESGQTEEAARALYAANPSSRGLDTQIDGLKAVIQSQLLGNEKAAISEAVKAALPEDLSALFFNQKNLGDLYQLATLQQALGVAAQIGQEADREDVIQKTHQVQTQLLGKEASYWNVSKEIQGNPALQEYIDQFCASKLAHKGRNWLQNPDNKEEVARLLVDFKYEYGLGLGNRKNILPYVGEHRMDVACYAMDRRHTELKKEVDARLQEPVGKRLQYDILHPLETFTNIVDRFNPFLRRAAQDEERRQHGQEKA
jgi:hypothetical protein